MQDRDLLGLIIEVAAHGNDDQNDYCDDIGQHLEHTMLPVKPVI
jgi:hypothetical protein